VLDEVGQFVVWTVGDEFKVMFVVEEGQVEPLEGGWFHRINHVSDAAPDENSMRMQIYNGQMKFESLLTISRLTLCEFHRSQRSDVAPCSTDREG
jgi:hypothetical protein